MTQEMFLMFWLGFACGLLMYVALHVLDSVRFWRPVFDVHYWLKERIWK